jgi:uncharacterized protein DUF3300
MVFHNSRLIACGLAFACALFAGSCNREKGKNAPAASSGGVTAGSQSATNPQLTPEYLDELLAPIALYPDVLLIQILTAATNPQEVLDAGNWLLQNTGLSNDQRIQAAKQLGFGPSTQALVQFPQVVDMMCQEMDWTKQVGEAFRTDQKAVLASAQRLRAKAVQAGSLQSTPQQTVKTENEAGREVVVVQPANPQIVYVPQYDPQQVYTAPPQQAAAPPQQVQSSEEKSSGVSTGTTVMTSLLSFGVGVALGSALHHDDYYYPNWGYGAAFYGPRPYVPAAYAYRPVYGPTFRPAYGYAAPARYPYAYNRQYGYGRNNVVVNQNNYYNRFHNNQNLANRNANINRPAYAGNAPNTRPGVQPNQQWRGQSTYAGGNREGVRKQNLDTNRSQYSASGARPNQSANRSQYPGSSNRSNQLAANRTNPSSNALAERTANSQRTFSRPPSITQSQNSRTAPPTAPTSADRGYGGGQAGAASEGDRSNAFSGASAREDRAASARGRQSVGGGNRSVGRGRRG